MPWAAPARLDARAGPNAALGRHRNLAQHHGHGRDWRTPEHVWRPLADEFALELDVAASPENALLPRYYTEADNGLAQPWAPWRCWLNPPWPA